MYFRAVVLLGACLLFVVALGRTQAPAVAHEQSDSWLEMSIDELSDGIAPSKYSEAVSTIFGPMSGHESTRAFKFSEGKKMVRATIWASARAVEDSALALDGTESGRALDVLADPDRRDRRLFRRLRSESYGSGEIGHLELVVFRTKSGKTREDNLQRFDQAEKDFSKGEGLLGHSLWISADGHWLHLLHWRSEADYAKTGKALMGTKGVGGWIRSLDFRRFTVYRGDI